MFKVPKYILINNGGEWVATLDQLCKNYGIAHQYTSPQCPKCNNMVERMVKTLKHELTVMAAIEEHAQD
jgi:transposase